MLIRERRGASVRVHASQPQSHAEARRRGERRRGENSLPERSASRSLPRTHLWRAVKETGSPAWRGPSHVRQAVRGDRRERTALRVGGGAPFDPHVLAPEHGMARCSRESPLPSLRARRLRCLGCGSALRSGGVSLSAPPRLRVRPCGYS